MKVKGCGWKTRRALSGAAVELVAVARVADGEVEAVEDHGDRCGREGERAGVAVEDGAVRVVLIKAEVVAVRNDAHIEARADQPPAAVGQGDGEATRLVAAGGADAFAVGKAENGVVTGDVIGPVDPNVRTGLRLCASAESEGQRPCRNSNCDPQGKHRVTSLGLSLGYGTRRVPTTFQ
jgi:hypothetical protein